MTEPLGAEQLVDDNHIHDHMDHTQLPQQEAITPVKREKDAVDNRSPVMDEIGNNGIESSTGIDRMTKMEVIDYASIKKEAIGATDKTKVKSERSKQQIKRKAEQTNIRRKSKRTTKSEKQENSDNQTKKLQTDRETNMAKVAPTRKPVKRVKSAPTRVVSTVAAEEPVCTESSENVDDVEPELPDDDGLDLHDVEVVEPTDPEEDAPLENADYGRNEPMQYTCDICDRTLANGYQMQRHLDTHQNERNYRCDQCDRTYKSSSSLAGHLKTCHSGRRPYVCGTCGKTFPRQNSLNRHNMIHTGEKPFECEECGKRFPQNAYLKAHMRNHTGEKPYHCRDCGERFKHSGYLMDHRRRIHTGEKRHECGVCGKLFARASDRQRHERTHSEPRATAKRQHKCDACGTRFKFREKLDDHAAEGKCKQTYRMDRAKPSPTKLKVRVTRGSAPPHKPGRKQLKPRRAKLKEQDGDGDGVQSDSSHASYHSDSKPTKTELHDAEQVLPGDGVPIVFFEDDAPPRLKERVDGPVSLADASQYRCETCDERFETSSDLINHNKTHKKQFRCVTCDLSFAWSLDLVKHTKTHSDRGEKYEYQIYNKRYQSDKLQANEHPC